MKMSPGWMSSPNASIVEITDEGIAPTCTGMYSAWATSSPFASVIAVEKSRLELRICENEVRSMASPISSTMPTRRCCTTETVIGSGVFIEAFRPFEAKVSRLDHNPRAKSTASRVRRRALCYNWLRAAAAVASRRPPHQAPQSMGGHA